MADIKIALPKNYVTLSDEEKINALESIIKQAQEEVVRLQYKIDGEGMDEEVDFEDIDENTAWEDAMDLMYPNSNAEEREEELFDRFAKGD